MTTGKIIRRTLRTLGVVIVLLIAAAILLPIIFKKQIVALVQKEVNKNINGTLTFDPDISLSLFRSFPDFSLGIKDIKLINKAPFEGDTLVKMDDFRATLDIMSVINGGVISIKSFTLDKPNVNLLVNKDGKANWDIALKDQDSVAAAGGDTTSNFHMNLQRYEINNANIVYDDQQAGMYSRLTNMTHTGKGDFTAEVFDLDTDTEMDKMYFSYGGVPYLNDVRTKLKMVMNMDLPKMKFTFKENKLDLNELAIGFDGWGAMPKNDIEMDMKFDAKQTDFKNILSLIPAVYTADFKNLKTSGKFALNGTAKGIYNETTYPAMDIKMAIDNGYFQYPDLPAPVKNVNVDTRITHPGGDLNKMEVNVSKAHFELAGDPFDARLFMRTLMTDPYLDASMKGRIVLDNVKKIVKLDPGTDIAGVLNADVSMKGNMSTLDRGEYDKFAAQGFITGERIKYASADLPNPIDISTTRLDFNPRNVTLGNTAMKVGRSDLALSGSLDNFLGYMMKGQTLEGKLNLNSTMLDVNSFMKPAAPQQAPAQPAQPAQPMEAPQLPANIDFTLNSHISRLIYDTYDISNFDGFVILRDQKLSLETISMNMLGAGFKLNGFYDSKDAQKPQTKMNFSITNLSIPEMYKSVPAVQKFSSMAKYMSGMLNANLSLSTPLNKDMTPVWKEFFSEGLLNIPEVKLSGYPPLVELSKKLGMEKYNNLTIKNIKPAYVINEGKITLKDAIKFNIDKTQFNVLPGGYTTLEKVLNYNVEITMPAGEAKTQANTALNQLLKGAVKLPEGNTVTVSALITGTVDKPEIKLNLGKMAADIVKNLKDQATEEYNKKKKELEDAAKAKYEAEKKKLEEEANKKKKEVEDAANKKKQELEEAARKEKQRLEEEARKKKEEQEKKLKEELKKKIPGFNR